MLVLHTYTIWRRRICKGKCRRFNMLNRYLSQENTPHIILYGFVEVSRSSGVRLGYVGDRKIIIGTLAMRDMN